MGKDFSGISDKEVNAVRHISRKVQQSTKDTQPSATLDLSDYAKKHEHADLLLAFLEELQSSLERVAVANGGVASEDVAALVGATEMQVPHTDLLPGQVQVICALTETSSTLVYDPKLQRPSHQDVAKMMGVEASELKEEGQFGLVYKSFPLVLPVKDVYRNMVESYDATNGPFDCGDAVQIRDGIVHAGPGCEDQPGEPRVVVFMTYRTFRDEHYEFTFQAKLWDWASHPAIPPMVAYKRLQEVYRFGVDNGMDIKPWTYYPPESLEACKMLCTTPGLDEMTVELLVEEWREMLYDENVQIVNQDQEKSALMDAWQREEDQYELIMVMRRSFRRHFFTFFILSMAVLSGATSLFCPLSIDMLAGRLSINVTVLLSMVAFSVQRPSAIEAVPYNTIHDIFVQVCTLLTATLSLCNLATQLTCFEMTEGCDECVREENGRIRPDTAGYGRHGGSGPVLKNASFIVTSSS
ncbi:unnamed protein product [Cladocopium goreaui]|uniref:Uncharacterized protein n=1 Tax=Cladocopium goreaui TaxID=2562237 RepID=A0A9P1DG01_9DINO|nr:unnamed protein product [Cladocopium goreaui]